MEMTQESHKLSSLLGWLTFERRNWLAITLASFALGFSIGNGHTTQGAIQDVSQKLGQKSGQLHALQTSDIPKLKAKVGCEQHRADQATIVAKQAIKGALSDSAPIPAPSSLPKDDCPYVSIPLDLRND